MLGGLAVGGVELGGLVGVVARDRRLLVVTGLGLEDQVVGRAGRHLPADAVEQQLGGGVVVDLVGEADASHQAVQRPRLRLGGRGLAAVGLAAVRRGGPLVVVAPAGRPVAVEVDAVGAGDLAVGVVVAQVLAPQPVALGEGVVVAVGVGHRDEPQLGAAEQLAQVTVAGVALDDVAEQAQVHLRGDPLPGVLGRGVEDRGPGAVTHLPRAAGHLDGVERLALEGGAQRDQLGQGGVLASDLAELVADAARLAVGLEDRRLLLLGEQPRDRLAVDPLLLQGDARGDQLVGHLLGHHHLDADPAVGARLAGGRQVLAVQARAAQIGDLAPGELADVHARAGAVRLGRWGRGARPRHRGGEPGGQHEGEEEGDGGGSAHGGLRGPCARGEARRSHRTPRPPPCHPPTWGGRGPRHGAVGLRRWLSLSKPSHRRRPSVELVETPPSGCAVG